MLLLLSCTGNELDNNPIVQSEEEKAAVDSNITMDVFIPDSTVNNRLKLAAPSSLKTFFIGSVELVDFLRESPVAVFCNKDKSEYLLAYQYEGTVRDGFSCFEIGYMNDTILRQKFANVDSNIFSTESEIKLGLSVKSLIEKKGDSYKILGRDTIIEYRVPDMNSDFLKRYNMPGYFIQCAIHDEKIKRIKFGFDYP
jgi:hypothetical protein